MEFTKAVCGTVKGLELTNGDIWGHAILFLSAQNGVAEELCEKIESGYYAK